MARGKIHLTLYFLGFAGAALFTILLIRQGVTAVGATIAVSPTALLVPGTGPASVLPTLTLAGTISSIAQVQVQAGATSSVVNLDVGAPAKHIAEGNHQFQQQPCRMRFRARLQLFRDSARQSIICSFIKRRTR